MNLSFPFKTLAELFQRLFLLNTFLMQTIEISTNSGITLLDGLESLDWKIFGYSILKIRIV